MILKEVSELRRRIRPDKNALSRIYGCYVNCNREVISYLDESLGAMTLEESEMYLGLLRKTLSGGLDRNLMDIEFATSQVVNSEEHKLLTALRNTELKDVRVRNQFYQKVIDALVFDENNYLILLACDTYDVPYYGKDGEEQKDSSEQVFRYILCAVCPVKDGKVELGFSHGDNEFHSCMAKQIVAQPEMGFLFPAFDDRAANIYNALFYTRDVGEMHPEFIDAVFHTEPPLSSVEQRNVFQSTLAETLDKDCSMDVVQAVHEKIRDKITLHKESKSPETLTLSANEVGTILSKCGVSEEKVTAFQERCYEQFGNAAQLHPENIIDSKRFVVKTQEATISVDPELSHLVEMRVINGRKYILIPAQEGVEINGMAVELTQP